MNGPLTSNERLTKLLIDLGIWNPETRLADLTIAAKEIDRLKARENQLELGYDRLRTTCNRLQAELAEAQRDAEFATSIERVLIRYIDRMNDVVPEDPADKILSEFLAEVNPLYTARFRSKGAANG